MPPVMHASTVRAMEPAEQKMPLSVAMMREWRAQILKKWFIKHRKYFNF